MKIIIISNFFITLILELLIKLFFSKQFTDEGILVWNIIPYWLIFLFSMIISIICYFTYYFIKKFSNNKLLIWLFISILNGIIFYIFNYSYIYHFSKIIILLLIFLYLNYWYLVIYKNKKTFF